MPEEPVLHEAALALPAEPDSPRWPTWPLLSPDARAGRRFPGLLAARLPDGDRPAADEASGRQSGVDACFLRSPAVTAADEVAETCGRGRLLGVLVWLLTPGSRLRAAIRQSKRRLRPDLVSGGARGWCLGGGGSSPRGQLCLVLRATPAAQARACFSGHPPVL